MKTYTLNEIRKHNTRNDAWVVIHEKVYNITSFINRHPGGDIITLSAGKDATILFETYHTNPISTKLLSKLAIGHLVRESEEINNQIQIHTLKTKTQIENDEKENNPNYVLLTRKKQTWENSKKEKARTLQDITNINNNDNDNDKNEKTCLFKNDIEPESHKSAQNTATSYYSWDSEFYGTLKRRVLAELQKKNKTLRGGKEILVKSVLLVSAYFLTLWWSYTIDCSGFLGYLAPIMLGLEIAFIGTCVQHDGNHGAISSSPIINSLAGAMMDLIGSSSVTWEIQHNLGHHPFTNNLGNEKSNTGSEKEEEYDQESDPDIFSSYPLLRLHPSHPLYWYHKYQHFYAPFIFGFLTIGKVFIQDYQIFFSRKLYYIDASCRYADPHFRIRFWVMKAFSLNIALLIPAYIHGWYHSLLMYLIMHFVGGFFLASLFIVNHVTDGVSYISKNGRPMTIFGKTKSINTKKKTRLNDWASVQCQTSVNWAPHSWIWNHFSGGLNHQIEHHLFPGVCHTNYYYIQPIVEKTCKEYGVPYQKEPTLFTAYMKMLFHLKNLGQEP